ncbi:MAG: tyrosine-type recombinase/integrase [Streptosporangiaceae bacterium]
MPGRKSRSFGSLRRLPSSRWQARYRGPDGRLYTAPGTFERKTDGARWLSLTEAEIVFGNWVDPEGTRVPIKDYGEVWIEERPGLRPKTIQLYSYLLRRHIVPGFTTVGTITEADVRRWRADLIANGVSPVTGAKAYRLLKAVLATAVEDGLIRRNPCRLKGGGTEHSPERPLLTVGQVYALADACGPRYYALVLLACFCGLRWGELVALRRRDVHLDTATVRVTRQLTEVNGRAPQFTPPKTAAGRRVVIIPSPVLPAVEEHLEAHALPGPDGLLFTSPEGKLLRNSAFRNRVWLPAITATGLTDVHFHDLRHAGNNLVAEAGATIRELMDRMGHASSRAALIYLHSSPDRQRALADAIAARTLNDLGRGQ